MKILFVFVCLFFLSSSTLHSAAIITPVNTTLDPSVAYQRISSLKVKDVQKLIGRKLTIKEKVSFLILKHVLKKKAKDSKQGETALGFGIAGAVMLLLGLFIPYVIIGALIGGILAVVLGSVAKRQDPSDKKAYAATLLGWITLGGIALILILAIIVLSSWGWY